MLSLLRSLTGHSHISRSLFSLAPHSAPYPPRTHNCGSLSAAHSGSRVVLAGWLLPGRKGKHMSFFPLKDSYGTTQLIVHHSEPHSNLACHLATIPTESTVLIEGTVLLRPENARRLGSTEEIEVQVEGFTLLNPAGNLPFLPSNSHNLPNEDLRAQFRYLDLRRTALSANLKRRSQVTHLVRNVLQNQGFIDVETPALLRSSVEGAREFIVPTRSAKVTASDPHSEPTFYALQQSPQQPKQLLICSGGVDKYYQIAKCFRDEDGRKDRQPEFTQIDMEMAFVSWGKPPILQSGDDWRIGGLEVRDVTERLVREIWHQVEGVSLPDRFQVMTYVEAMTTYGSDKPDIRFDLQINDITGYLPAREQATLTASNEVLECFVVRQTKDSQFIRASRIINPESPVGKITVDASNANSWLTQNPVLMSDCVPDLSKLNGVLRLEFGDDIWLSRRRKKFNGGSTVLGKSRLRLSELSQELGDFIISNEPNFLWITEFPLFTRDEEKDFLAKGRWSSSHHPFTAPMWEDVNALYSGNFESVRGQHYDLVLNGVEIGGGSVRVHDAAMQDYIFTKILELNDQEKAPFDRLLHALQCGAPPHGGIALGLDRMMAMLCGSQSIRDVIAFPKTSTGTDLLFKSPAPVKSEILEQYGIVPQKRGF